MALQHHHHDIPEVPHTPSHSDFDRPLPESEHGGANGLGVTRIRISVNNLLS